MMTPEKSASYSVYAGEYHHLAYIICDEHNNAPGLKHGAHLLRLLTRVRIPKKLLPPASPGAVTDRLGTFLFDISAEREGVELSEATKIGLKRSRFLIVIASPFAARSARINAVVRYFKMLPQAGNLMTISIDGLPYAKEGSAVPESLPQEIRNLVDKDGNAIEVISPVIAPGEYTWDTAVTLITAAMIGRENEDLAQRFQAQKRRKLRRWLMGSTASVLLLFIGGYSLLNLTVAVRDTEYYHTMAALDDAWERGNHDTAFSLLMETRSAPNRRFEWYHWARRLNPENRSGILALDRKGDAGRWEWRAHQCGIEHIALSQDGCMAITSAGNEVAIWNTETGSAVHRYVETYPVTAVAFSPQGRFWATGDSEGQVLIRGMSDEWVILVHVGDGIPIQRLAISPRGDQLLMLPRRKNPIAVNNSAKSPMDIFSKADSGVELISLGKGTEFGSDLPPSHPLAGLLTAGSRSGVQDAVYLQGGDRILSVALNGFLELWDARARRRLNGFSWGTRGVRTLAISPDSSQLLMTGADIASDSFLTRGVDDLLIRAIRDGKLVKAVTFERPNCLTTHLEAMEPFGSEKPLLLDARFVGDTTRIIQLSYEDAAINMYETKTMTPVLTLRVLKGHPQCIDVSADGKQIAAGTDEGIVVVWSSTNQSE